MGDERKKLPCGCEVTVFRDFLGRGLGKIVTPGEQCPYRDHGTGYVIVMPGRQYARPE
jgi:hypothetical protein